MRVGPRKSSPRDIISTAFQWWKPLSRVSGRNWGKDWIKPWFAFYIPCVYPCSNHIYCNWVHAELFDTLHEQKIFLWEVKKYYGGFTVPFFPLFLVASKSFSLSVKFWSSQDVVATWLFSPSRAVWVCSPQIVLRVTAWLSSTFFLAWRPVADLFRPWQEPSAPQPRSSDLPLFLTIRLRLCLGCLTCLPPLTSASASAPAARPALCPRPPPTSLARLLDPPSAPDLLIINLRVTVQSGHDMDPAHNSLPVARLPLIKATLQHHEKLIASAAAEVGSVADRSAHLFAAVAAQIHELARLG